MLHVTAPGNYDFSLLSGKLGNRRLAMVERRLDTELVVKKLIYSAHGCKFYKFYSFELEKDEFR